MSLSSSHQSHMNIQESRRHAVKLMTRETGMQYFIIQNDYQKIRQAKGRMITYIKKGYYDNWYFKVDYDAEIVTISPNRVGDMLHQIGS